MRDLTSLAAWARGLLTAQAIVAGLAITVALAHGPGFDDEDGSAAYLVIALVQSLLFIATAIPVLRWVYFASANVRVMGAEGLGSSPAMAVGWYFVPIANLAMPFQAMREMWKASHAPRDWEIAPGSPLLGWWWAAWLIGNLAGMIAFRLDFDKRFSGSEAIAEPLTTLSDAMTIAASLLLARIIGRITERQSAFSES